jgi:hypothetical protein
MNNRPALGSLSVAGVLILVGSLFPLGYAEGGQIVFSPPGPPRDRLPPLRVGSSSLKGRVEDGTTGAPVVRARIRIGLRPPVMTDASGAFSFAGLPAGPYTLSIDKRGYQSASYPEHGRGMRSISRPLILQEGETRERITVRLFRGGVITGRVVDANGEPLDSVSVRAFKVAAAPRSGGRPMPGNSASTNDLGEFRLARLDGGSYVLMATPQHSAGADETGPDGKPQPQPAPTYYPDVVAMEQAQVIAVQLGQTLSGIDITMSEALMAVIMGTVVDQNGQPAGPNARISISSVAKDGSGSSGSTSTSLRPDGTFRARVAPGDYFVEASLFSRPAGAASGRNEYDTIGTESVTATSGSIETLLITLGTGATATGRVVFDGTSLLPQNVGIVSVPFFSTNGGRCASRPAEVAADWSFKIEGLAGTCSNMAWLGLGRWMLKAVLYDGADLMDRAVTFKAGQQYRNVQVIFTDRPAAVSFRVSDEEGQTTREYVALVLPLEKTRWNTRPNSSPVRAYVPPPAEMVALQGSPPTARAPILPTQRRGETMEGLRPGEYVVIAVDNIESEDTRDSGVLEKLAANGTRITLKDGDSIEVPLRRLSLANLLR